MARRPSSRCVDHARRARPDGRELRRRRRRFSPRAATRDVFGRAAAAVGLVRLHRHRHQRARARCSTRSGDFVNGFRADPGPIGERVFVSCGVYESLIYENRSLVPLLQSTGMEVRYVEARDGHNWENWRDRLRDGLVLAVPGPAVDGLRVAASGSPDRTGVPMADVTRRIGLSLGADICWPICFEEIMRRLDLAIAGRRRHASASRSSGVTIEPFDLRQPCRYDLVVDRLTHWYHDQPRVDQEGRRHGRPVRLQQPVVASRRTRSTPRYCAMMRARAARSPTRGWCRRRSTSRRADLDATLHALRPALRPRRRSATQLGYPMFMKPYDGGGWVGVTGSTTRPALRDGVRAERHLRHAPPGARSIPSTSSCAASASGRRRAIIRYDPAAPLHDRYTMDDGVLGADERSRCSRT